LNATSIFFALAIGLLIPFQGLLNSRLSSTIGHPYGAALVNFTGGLIIFIIANFFSPTGFPKLKVFFEIPPYLLLGGLVGSFFIIGAIFLLPKLGATTWIALIVTGQLLMSLIMDHYGVLGLNIVKINIFRILGALMLLSGVFLIQKN